MYWKKKFYFVEPENLIKRNIPKDEIRRMLRLGVIVDNYGIEKRKERRKLCIFKKSARQYFTIVFEPIKDYVFIITGYPSKKWEIDCFKRNKKFG